MNRLMLAFTIALFVLSACKGCADPCKNVECAGGEVCIEGECGLVNFNCVPECDPGQVCEQRVCVTPEVQCEAAGDECDAGQPTGDGFLCLDLDNFGPRPGECVQGCAEDGSCPSGSLCFFVTSASDDSCETTADCEAGRECSGGVCLQTICRPSECDSFVEGAETCSELYRNTPGFEGGAQCYDVGNDARYCYPAGDQSAGDACGNAIDAIIDNNFAPTCQSGLACVDDVCRVACLDDEPCTGGEECILEEEDFVGEDTGICGAACTPFETGACGDGQTCIPVSAAEGVCAPAGDQPAFAACTPGAGECVDGTLCVTYQNDPVQIARCQPVCNLTVAEANEDGSVGEFAQTQRDATCPQPAQMAQSYVIITNFAEIGAAVDVYVGDDMTPTVAALALDARSDGDDMAAGEQFIALEPGATPIKLLTAGAPSTDPPLAELTLNLVSDAATEVFVLPIAGALDEVELLTQPAVRDEPAPAAGAAKIRSLAGLADEPAIDVVLVPPMDDLSDPTNQVELAGALAQGTLGPFVEVTAGDWDLLVFAAGDPRTTRATALVSNTLTITDGQIATLVARGTVDPDDSVNAGSSLQDLVEPPAAGQSGPVYTCVDTQGGTPFGYCQQDCGNTSARFGTCEGDQMGCHPTFLPANNRWASLCSPLGDKALDEPCNPFAEYGECGEGLYCLEYGNTVANYDALQRGRCTSLCVEGAAADPVLSCADGQACETISFDPDYLIGQCGYRCDPNGSYGDPVCPAGLESCKPKAALIEDPANPDALPTTMVTQSFCSAAGDVAAGATCTANDCEAGSECLFPRSAQQTFTAGLLSQYFGGAGLTPACQPQCDPFEGDSAPASCGAGETCLFNFPYSAEVGHCTEVDVELEPLEACSNPGRSCGQDSICVVNGGAPTCFQFCQYTGPDATGELQPESCGAGLVCAPLVNDIGVCLSPI